jgi:hypothetical protein
LPADRLDGQFLLKSACIALLAHFQLACQAKQGAVVDVFWNQRCLWGW